MFRKLRSGAIAVALLAFCAFLAQPAAAKTLKIGYSDWPGWVAWQVAIDKGWLKAAGLDVKFQWFDYSASMDAYTAGKIDADLVSGGDALVTGANGGKGVIVLITDYSNGNDIIVGRPGIRSVKQLKGKKVGIEVGLVEHLLLNNALKKNGMKKSDVSLVNAKTNETPQVLASGQVAAIGAWQPNAGMAMRMKPGSRPIYTSAKAPGLIYDMLYVNPTSLAAHRADYIKLIRVWGKVVKYIENPKTQSDALRIMSKRVGLSPAAYKPLLKGTFLISPQQAKQIFVKGPHLSSVYGSLKNADAFNVENHVYKKAQNIAAYIDPSLNAAAVK